MSRMRRWWPIFLIVLVATIIVSAWFKSNRLIAVGEEGLWMYQPGITLRHYFGYWNEIGLGTSDAFFLPRITHIFFLNMANSFMTNWQAQALSFWILLIVGCGGCYILLQRLLPEERVVCAIGALFYVFNLYSISQVWGRYISAGIFTWAFLPLFLWNWMVWIDTGNKKWLFLFMITNIIFANAFGSPVFIFTFWLPAILYLAVTVKQHGAIVRSIVAAGCWGIMHMIWLYPFLITSSASFSRFSGFDYNFNSLLSVSHYFGIDQLLVLRQGFLFGQANYFNGFFNLTYVLVSSLLIFAIVLVGLLKNPDTLLRKYFILLFILGVIICKGSQPPFGFGLFYTAFKYFSPSMLLRNPYEKYGPAYLLAYVGIFSVGLAAVRKHRRILLLTLLAVVLTSIPVWTGSMHNTRLLSVPDYYAQTNAFLNQDFTEFRTLILPIVPGEAVRYPWPDGTFEGAEPSEFLFDKNVISRTDFDALNFNKYFELHDTFVGQKDPTILFDELGVKYLVLHHDQDFTFSTASTSAQVEKTLNRIPQVKFIKNIGELSVYEYTNFKPLVVFESSTAPEFDWNRVNSDHYVLKIKDNKSPFKLILKQAFHPRWTAVIGKELPLDHFIAYGYANGWQTDKLGSYTIDLKFKVWPWQ